MSSLFHYDFRALGTACALRVAHPDRAAADDLACAVADLVRALEARWSRYRPDSWLSRLNAAAGSPDWFETEPDDDALLHLCSRAHALSEGAIDPTILPLIRLWDSAPTDSEPSPTALATALTTVGWHRIAREPGRIRLPLPGMALDLGGLAKEYLVDRALELARQKGFDNVLVDFGGDIAVHGAPPGRPGWLIALAAPTTPNASAGSLLLGAGAVATSGDSARSRRTADGSRRSHVIDPRTGRPTASPIVQATVLAPSCIQAGFLSTLCLLQPDAESAIRLLEGHGAKGRVHDALGRVLHAADTATFLSP